MNVGSRYRLTSCASGAVGGDPVWRSLSSARSNSSSGGVLNRLINPATNARNRFATDLRATMPFGYFHGISFTAGAEFLPPRRLLTVSKARTVLAVPCVLSASVTATASPKATAKLAATASVPHPSQHLAVAPERPVLTCAGLSYVQIDRRSSMIRAGARPISVTRCHLERVWLCITVSPLCGAPQMTTKN